MKYFSLSLCLVVLWTSGSVVGSGNVKITQEPNPVRSGGKVTVTCIIAMESADLQWKTSNGTVVIRNTQVNHDEGSTSNTLRVNLSAFQYGRTVSCGVKDQNDTWKNYTICVTWGIIRPPQDIIVHKADEKPKTMSCLVIEECIAFSNPWFYQNGKQVENNSGITVTHKLVGGTNTVIEWELQFADLKQEDIFSSYTCRASPSTADTAPPFSANATLKRAVTPSIKIPPQNVTVKKGSPVPSSMTCVIIGDYDSATIPWTHNDATVKNGSGVTVEKPLIGDGVVVYYLTFQNVTDANVAGGYTCAVESDSFSATATLISETPESSTTDTSTSSDDGSSAGVSNSSSSQLTATTVAPSTTAPRTPSSSPRPTPSGSIADADASNSSGNESSTSVSIASFPQPTATVSPSTTVPSAPPPSPTINPTANGHQPVSIVAIAVAVVVILVLCGAVFLVYWKRHTLREWLMEKDVVKVMKKGKRGKGYKYSKLPRDISTSMKHLE